MKADFTRLQSNVLQKSTVDPLARALRRQLKKRKVKTNKVEIIFSAEKTKTQLLPLTRSQLEQKDEAQILENFRVRIVPVLGTSPALFGIAIAAQILTNLGGKPFKPFMLTDVQFLNYCKIKDRFYQSESLKKYFAHRKSMEEKVIIYNFLNSLLPNFLLKK